MRTGFDFSPLFRSTVGFDRMYRLLDSAAQAGESAQSYPPYNIVSLGDDQYRVTMAVAGFTQDEIEITQVENTLLVKGNARKDDGEKEEVRYLHRGIASRAFDHRFQLADHIHVTGAALSNGLLEIDLVRQVPEAMKPRTISIGNGQAPTAARLEAVEAKAA